MKDALLRCLSLSFAAFLALSSGVSLAGPSGSAPASSGIVIAGLDGPQQTQDPNTPPDCKKYPKDTRCKR